MGLLETDALRQPMLPLTEGPRARLTGILDELGLLGGTTMTEMAETETLSMAAGVAA